MIQHWGNKLTDSMPDSRSGDPGSKASQRRKVPAGAPHSPKTLRVIIVTGTPGVGKSRIAGQLARALESRHLDISKIVQERGLYSHSDKERDTLVADLRRLRLVIKKIMRASREEDFVVSTHYIDSLLPASAVSIIFVLRLRPTLLFKRLVRRQWSQPKVAENVEAELVGVCLVDAIEFMGRNRVYEIDATNRSVTGITKEMLKILRRKRRNLGRVGVVDWFKS